MVDKILVLFIACSSIAMAMIESGYYCNMISEQGHFNGATFAYVAFWGIFLIAYKLSIKKNIAAKIFSFPVRQATAINHGSFLIYVTLAHLIFLLLTLFFFGGIDVILGEIHKSEFRTNTVGAHGLGSLAFAIRKMISPSISAYLAFWLLNNEKTRRNIAIVASNIAFSFIIGASWGFKSTAFLTIMPALIVLFWDVSNRRFITTMVVFIAVAMLFSIFYDHKNGWALVLYLFERATVSQTEASWKIWDLFINGQLHLSYFKTYASSLGDKFLSMAFGINKEDYINFISYHYTLAATNLVYPYPEAIKSGTDMATILFSEALIAGGYFGLLIFPIVAGVFTGVYVGVMRLAMLSYYPKTVAVMSSFFVYYVLFWLFCGDTPAFLHVSNFFYIALTVVTLWLMEKISVALAARKNKTSM